MRLNERLLPVLIERNRKAHQYGSNHPEVRALDREIKTIKEELGKLARLQAAEISKNDPKAGPYIQAISKIQRLYESAEREAALAAQRYRKTFQEDSNAKEKLEKIEEEVRRHVESAFESRMQLQNAQLDAAEKEIDASRERLHTRQSNSEKIIERRIDELIGDGELTWLGNLENNVAGPESRRRVNSTAPEKLPRQTNSTLEVFPVGNLVSNSLFEVRGSLLDQPASLESHREAIDAAINEVIQIVEANATPESISKLPGKLSLLVRHSPKGHLAVRELLKTIGVPGIKTIRLRVDPVTTEDAGGEEEEKLELLMAKTILDRQEAASAIALTGNHFAGIFKQQALGLELGIPKVWQIQQASPTTFTARVDISTEEVELRIDQSIVGDVQSDQLGKQLTAVFRAKPGESIVFRPAVTDNFVWLLTPETMSDSDDKSR